jgi:hypothetical protein
MRALSRSDLFGDRLGASDQQFLEPRDASIERVGDLNGAAAEGFVDAVCDFRNPCIEGLTEGLRAAVEGLLKASESLIERGGHFYRLGGNATIEALEMGPHGIRHFLCAASEAIHDLTAIGFHRAVEFGQVAGDQIAERRTVTSNAFGELGAALRKHLLK